MDGPTAFLSRLEALLPAMQARAPALDRDAAFPAADLAELRDIGALRAALPTAAGGFGLATEAAGAADMLAMLRLLGRSNLALGRLLEAHVNAIQLVFRYAPTELQAQVAGEVRDGHLFGLWVTDAPGNRLRLTSRDQVVGEKMPCSGAGHVTRVVMTASTSAGVMRLVHARLDEGGTSASLAAGAAGMRATVSGSVRFDGIAAVPFGAAGDYEREPDFSCGAWRTSAVTLGGLDALLAEYRRQLRGRGRDGDPHQQARFGQALIAVETARLWVGEAALRAAPSEAMAAIPFVGLARLAVERAALDLVELVQRSLGLPALLRGSTVERICRDLATYLRQPAADDVLTEAAAAALRGEP